MLPELLDHIFPLLLYHQPLTWHRDGRYIKADLLNCSLVCRQWRDLTRRHIFHTTTFAFDRIHSPPPSPTTSEFKRGYRRHALQEFITFLEGTPEVCALIFRLNLVKSPTRLRSPGQELGRIDRKLIHWILLLLPALHHIMLDGLDMDTMGLSPLTLAPLAHIGTLDVRTRAPDSESGSHDDIDSALRDVAATIGIFASIGTLRLAHAQSVGSESERSTSSIALEIRARTRVASLDLMDYWPPDVLRCFDVRELESLRMLAGGKLRGDIPNLWLETLARDRLLGQQLRHLSFRLLKSGDDDITFCSSALEHCPNLRCVGLTFPDYSSKLHPQVFQTTNAHHWAFVSEFIMLMPHRVPELVLEFGQLPDGMHSLSGVSDEIMQRVEDAIEVRYGRAFPIVAVRNNDGSVLGLEEQQLFKDMFAELERVNALSFRPPGFESSSVR